MLFIVRPNYFTDTNVISGCSDKQCGAYCWDFMRY